MLEPGGGLHGSVIRLVLDSAGKLLYLSVVAGELGVPTGTKREDLGANFAVLLDSALSVMRLLREVRYTAQ